MSLFRFSFDTKFRIEGTGFCETLVDFGTPWQAAKAEFEILFDGALESDETFSYTLVGDGDGGSFELLDQDLIAYDVKTRLFQAASRKSKKVIRIRKHCCCRWSGTS